jgi:FAD/FMN-containing dehydrogenase
MNAYSILKTDGGRSTLTEQSIHAFASRFGGPLIGPDHPDYDAARVIWNAMIDRRPALIAQCRSTADVVEAVRFARDHRVLTAVRGAGHNIAGNAICDSGLVIDLSTMKSVTVDAARRTVRVEPGVTLGELDRATQAHGQATPTGINSTTGIAGLALGGGFGWLSRRHGLTLDNLVAADVVTAAGEPVRASQESHPDLFWGIRGGGGNLGVVTAFEFRTHPVGPQVLAGLVVHPFADAPRLLRQYRDFVAQAPEELTVWAVLRQAPPLPFLPAEVHGQEILVFAVCHTGPLEEAEEDVKPLRALGRPLADVVGPTPFAAWQSAFDPLMGPGLRNYWKSHNFTALPDGLIDTVIEYVERLPTGHSEAFIGNLGGAAGRVPVDVTAYAHRDANFVLNVHARWEEPGDDARCVAWARGFFAAAQPFATGGVYVNFMPGDEGDRVPAAYGANFQRLAALKREYDPDNLFRLNQNVRPGV